ncbi:hypothetical protein NDR87_30020 [Nocardia sp. CDC159]|uniref:Uncharacterized protein n=1 Tax=Nocardia pulmonis TaxID=2951408 RepID=A0A9X2J0E3_9NOCA|nr:MULTISPECIES: hypothetical protein [Nocardia]MCM6777729.1 hypothetical protein [Nocardia pulmonis]MCM6790614.1 hypothetical protein [Nocardia sp. CDC159]
MSKFVPSDDDIIRALHPSDTGTGLLGDHPRSILEIAIRAAGQHDIQPPKLPVQESDTDLWGRIVSFYQLRRSLDRLAETGVLIVGTGREWLDRHPPTSDRSRPEFHARHVWRNVLGSNPRGRYWATAESVRRWEDEDAARAAMSNRANGTNITLEITAATNQTEDLPPLLDVLRNIGGTAAALGFTVRLLADGEEIEP